MRKRIITTVNIVLIIALLASCATSTPTSLTASELLTLGERYLVDLDYEQAVAQFLAVIEIEPMNARAYIGAAEAYIALGRTDDAIAVLERGYVATGDAEIREMLEGLTPAMTPTADSTATAIVEMTPESTGVPNDITKPNGVDVNLEVFDARTGRITLSGISVKENYTINTSEIGDYAVLVQWWVRLDGSDGTIAVWTGAFATEQKENYVVSLQDMQTSVSLYNDENMDCTIGEATVSRTNDGIAWDFTLPEVAANYLANDGEPFSLEYDLRTVTNLNVSVYDITQGGRLFNADYSVNQNHEN